jgi:hypothetical protein
MGRPPRTSATAATAYFRLGDCWVGDYFTNRIVADTSARNRVAPFPCGALPRGKGGDGGRPGKGRGMGACHQPPGGSGGSPKRHPISASLRSASKHPANTGEIDHSRARLADMADMADKLNSHAASLPPAAKKFDSQKRLLLLLKVLNVLHPITCPQRVVTVLKKAKCPITGHPGHPAHPCSSLVGPCRDRQK